MNTRAKALLGVLTVAFLLPAAIEVAMNPEALKVKPQAQAAATKRDEYNDERRAIGAVELAFKFAVDATDPGLQYETPGWRAHPLRYMTREGECNVPGPLVRDAQPAPVWPQHAQVLGTRPLGSRA